MFVCVQPETVTSNAVSGTVQYYTGRCAEWATVDLQSGERFPVESGLSDMVALGLTTEAALLDVSVGFGVVLSLWLMGLGVGVFRRLLGIL